MKGFVGGSCFESQVIVRKDAQFSLNEITQLAKCIFFIILGFNKFM